MNLSVESQAVDGPEIVIDCPACGAQRTPASSQQVTEKLRLLHFIPLLTMRHNYVWCKACQKKLVSSLDVEDLAQRSNQPAVFPQVLHIFLQCLLAGSEYFS